jgi:hypothetical protein
MSIYKEHHLREVTPKDMMNWILMKILKCQMLKFSLRIYPNSQLVIRKIPSTKTCLAIPVHSWMISPDTALSNKIDHRLIQSVKWRRTLRCKEFSKLIRMSASKMRKWKGWHRQKSRRLRRLTSQITRQGRRALSYYDVEKDRLMKKKPDQKGHAHVRYTLLSFDFFHR